MRRSRPPRLATWLLSRMTSNPTRESLVGDLIERFHRGRSSGWYWRQVIKAILADTANEFRSHPWLSLRAIVIGFSVLVLFQALVLGWLRTHAFEGVLWIGNRWIKPAAWWPMAVWYLWLPPAGFSSGWLVGRLHSRHRFAMTRVFAGSFITWQVVQVLLWYLTIDLSGWNPKHYALTSLIWFVTILMGGLWALPTEGRSELN